MFDLQKAGSVFHLKDQVQYEKDKAVKQVYIDQNGVRMLLVAIDHSLLPDHPAPADALVMVLEGSGAITYNNTVAKVKEHDFFKFDKGVIHSVKADKLKFALLFA